MDMNMESHQLLDADMGEAVRSTAMLADVTIAVWGAERSDAKIMEQARITAGATGNVGRAIKNMLAGADNNLKEARAAYSAVRALHYAMTLPWVSDPHAERQRGPRLLPNMLFEKYMTGMSRTKRAAEQALDKFIAGYDDDVIKARANLAALADAVYPTGQEVRGMFKVSFDFEPIPAGNAFRGLPPAFSRKLADSLEAKQRNMAASAQSAMWEQVSERVGRLATRLGDADTKFKATTIEGVRELLTYLPGWNVTSDPRAAEIVADIDRMLGGADAEAIRKSTALRASVADQAAEITRKLQGWGL